MFYVYIYNKIITSLHYVGLRFLLKHYFHVGAIFIRRYCSYKFL